MRRIHPNRFQIRCRFPSNFKFTNSFLTFQKGTLKQIEEEKIKKEKEEQREIARSKRLLTNAKSKNALGGSQKEGVFDDILNAMVAGKHFQNRRTSKNYSS